MADERYGRGSDPRGDYYNRDADDYGSGRDNSYSSAREYQAAGLLGDDRGGRGGYGREQGAGRSDYNRSDYNRSDYGAQDYGHQRYGQRERFGQDSQRDQGGYYRSEGRGPGGDRDRGQNRSYGRQPQGYNYEDRGFFDRAGDEVRSWFGDDDAERRRDMDQRHDERSGQTGRTRHDDDYHSWRSGQMAALDRDYDEYRRENRSRFEKEFSTWRTNRQGQRDAMKRVTEHQEVVGSDGQHVGTVDKVKGDRILLTKNDKDAGGQHHSIPCSWITSVDDKVTLNKSADEAKQAWRDEDRDTAMSGYGDNAKNEKDDMTSDRNLNRSFPGTY